MVAAQQVPQLASVFTTYGAATPQIYLKLDRERAQTLGVSISDIFSALQTAMGGTYANDFNLFGRTWQVKVQADARRPQQRRRHLPRARAHHRTASWCRCRPWPTSSWSPRPSSIIRYNNLRSVTMNGAPAPGYSSGQAIAAMEKLAKADAAGRLRLRMDRHGAAGEGGAGQTGSILGARRALRLPLPGRPLREHGDPARRAAVGRRSACSAPWPALLAHRPRQQHLRPDRHRRADRARRQERHPDRRVRHGASARRARTS